uniref:Uncharacterized protein n=1 Tax=Nelumbo nucifera TaxID=4432 RepID=A0A822YR74_NELNU|nr:TPA_asm: hypothetical protein HUJ06_005283 [Nelumbo nucifera]
MGFGYNLLAAVGIDLSANFLHGEILVVLFGLQDLEYLNLSHLLGLIPGS